MTIIWSMGITTHNMQFGIGCVAFWNRSSVEALDTSMCLESITTGTINGCTKAARYALGNQHIVHSTQCSRKCGIAIPVQCSSRSPARKAKLGLDGWATSAQRYERLKDGERTFLGFAFTRSWTIRDGMTIDTALVD